MRRGVTHLDGWIPSRGISGQNFLSVIPHAELWDGGTYYVEEKFNGLDYHYPSNSAAAVTKVCGPGTAWWMGLTASQLVYAIWRIKRSALTLDGQVTATSAYVNTTVEFPDGQFLTDDLPNADNDWASMVKGRDLLAPWDGKPRGLFASDINSSANSVALDAGGNVSHDIVTSVACAYGDSIATEIRYNPATRLFYVEAGGVIVDVFTSGTVRTEGPISSYPNVTSQRPISFVNETFQSMRKLRTPQPFYITFRGQSLIDSIVALPNVGFSPQPPQVKSMELKVDGGGQYNFADGTPLAAVFSIPILEFKATRHVISSGVLVPPPEGQFGNGSYAFAPVSSSNLDILQDVESNLTVRMTPQSYLGWGGLYDETTGARIPLDPPTA